VRDKLVRTAALIHHAENERWPDDLYIAHSVAECRHTGGANADR
jgi:hypothetical protein